MRGAVKLKTGGFLDKCAGVFGINVALDVIMPNRYKCEKNYLPDKTILPEKRRRYRLTHSKNHYYKQS